MSDVTHPTGRRSSILPFRISAFGILAGVLAAGLIYFTVYPILVMIWTALFADGGLNVELWMRTAAGRGLGEATLNTIIIVIACTVLCVPIALVFAWINERTDAHMGVLSTFLPIVPLLLPPVALSIGWLFLGDPNAGFITAFVRWIAGWFGVPPSAISFGVYSWPGLIFVYLLFLVPNAYVVIAAGFRSLDPSLEEAARMSGRNPFECFFAIAVPAVKPAIGAAALLTAIAAAELYSIPAIVGTPAQIIVLPTYLRRLIHGQYPPAIDQAVTIGLLMAIVIGALWLMQRHMMLNSQYARIGGMGVRPNRISMGKWRLPARILMLSYLAFTSVLPVLALCVVALQRYWTPEIVWSELSLGNFISALNSRASINAIVNSLILGVGAATIAVLIAAVLSIYASDVKGKRGMVAGLATKLPAALSTLVLAIGMLIAFGGSPFYLNGTLWILLICYVIARITGASIVIESAVAQIGNQLGEASRVNGSSRIRTLLRIQLPLSASGMAAAWALIFAIIVGDLTAAAILSGPTNPVIGYRILSIYDYGTYSELAALGLVICVISGVCVTLVMKFARPRFSSNK